MRIRLDSAQQLVGAWRQDDAGDAIVRYDRGVLLEPTKTDEGYLVTEAVVARPGVLFYRLPGGGYRRELVLPEELADQASMASIAHKPVTLEHPSNPVGPHNVGQHGQGSVSGEPRIDEAGRLIVPVVVRKAQALKALGKGVREISPGYDLRELEMTAGTHALYGAYDAIQRGRRYNHIAITENARGGAECEIRTDGGVEVDIIPAGPTSTPASEAAMNPIVAMLLTLGLTKEVAEASLETVQTTVGGAMRADSAAELEAEKTKTAAEKTRADNAESLAARLAWHNSRSHLEGLAAKHKVEGDLTKLDSAELGRAVLKKADVDTEGRSDVWVDARCDSMELDATVVVDPFANVRQDAKGGDRQDSPKRPPTTHRSVQRYATPAAK